MDFSLPFPQTNFNQIYDEKNFQNYDGFGKHSTKFQKLLFYPLY
jgi:hypothetical protein